MADHNEKESDKRGTGSRSMLGNVVNASVCRHGDACAAGSQNKIGREERHFARPAQYFHRKKCIAGSASRGTLLFFFTAVVGMGSRILLT